MSRPTPFREIVLRTWRGPGAPGGWHVTARLLNRHGHILWQVPAKAILASFRFGDSMADIAKAWRIDRQHVEQILRLMMGREVGR